MKTTLLALGLLLVIANTCQAQTYLSPDWLVQPDLPLSTGPVYVAGATKTVDDATYVIGDFRNGADFDISASDTSYVKTTYNHSQFLAKYDKAGKLLFEISLGSSFSQEYGYNFFTGVASDAEGNAYITGCFGYGFDFDPGPAVVSFPAGYYDRYLFVAKYDKDGHLVFADPITTKNDKTFPYAIAVDKQSNVYIAGTVAGTNNDFDPNATIVSLNGDKNGDGFFAKYDKSGNFLFAKLLTGSAGEVVNAIATDKNNNLLATGYYDTNSNDFDPGPDTAKLAYKGGGDLFFAKYSPNGDYLFAKSVGGKGGESANAIITDNRNNIIITGGFTGVDADFDPGKGKVLRNAAGSTYADIFIEKFDSLGNYKWVNTAGGSDDDGGVSLVSDKAGNIFISGFIKGTDVVFHNTTGRDTLKSAGGYDIVYAKYDSLGTCRYVQRIGDKKDNSGGNILLTGDSLITFTGNFIDSLDFNPSPQKNVLYALNNTAFFATYKSSNGAYVSAKEIGVFGYFRDESDIYTTTQDKAGNTYVIGYYTGITDFDPGPDTVLLTSRSEIAHDNGNYDQDQFFAKYDKDGKLVYVRTFTTTGHDAEINGLTVDDKENVYICGSYYGQINFVPGTDTAVFGKVGGYTLNMYFAKYDATGNYLFSVNLKSQLSSFSSIALDKQKNIYLTGLLSGSAYFNPADSTAVTISYGETDMLIAKYDSVGRFVYVKHVGQNGTIQGGYTDFVFPNDMAVSDSGRIVICGEMRGTKTDFDPGARKYYLSSGKSGATYFTAAYTLSGNLLFATAADTSSAGQTSAYKLALDGENAIIAGMSYDAADLYPGPDSSVITNRYSRDPFFIKYNSAGAIQFINTNAVSQAANNAMEMNDIAVDTSHHIYITGYTIGRVDFDFGADSVFLDSDANYIARYDSNGKYDYVQGLYSYPTLYTRALFINNQNEIVVAGNGYGNADVDPGPSALLFQDPVYHHSAFYITKYKQMNDDKKPKLLIARAGSQFRVFENLR